MRMQSGDYIYVILGEHDLVKIGISNDPTSRLANLQTASPFRLRLVFTAPAYGHAYRIEQMAHTILGRQRASGEWFKVTPDMAIAAVFAAADRVGCSLSQPQALAQRSRWRRLSTLVRVVILAAGYALADRVLPASLEGPTILTWLIGGAVLLR